MKSVRNQSKFRYNSDICDNSQDVSSLTRKVKLALETYHDQQEITTGGKEWSLFQANKTQNPNFFQRFLLCMKIEKHVFDAALKTSIFVMICSGVISFLKTLDRDFLFARVQLPKFPREMNCILQKRHSQKTLIDILHEIEVLVHTS